MGDPEVICAALLHDAVEDHADGLSPDGRAGALAALEAGFGPRVAALVAGVTNPVRAPGSDRAARNAQYRAHVADSLAASPWARVIKASGFTDNGVGVIYTSGPKAARLARKYAPLVPVLADLVARPDTAPVAPGQGPRPRPALHRPGEVRRPHRPAGVTRSRPGPRGAAKPRRAGPALSGEPAGHPAPLTRRVRYPA